MNWKDRMLTFHAADARYESQMVPVDPNANVLPDLKDGDFHSWRATFRPGK
jgi:hypothetical protein